jgi:hypothetical protein
LEKQRLSNERKTRAVILPFLLFTFSILRRCLVDNRAVGSLEYFIQRFNARQAKPGSCRRRRFEIFIAAGDFDPIAGNITRSIFSLRTLKNLFLTITQWNNPCGLFS